MSDLMFIESPAKIKSIGKYLSGKDINLFATYGHIRELKKGWINFRPGKIEPQWTEVEKVIEYESTKVPIIKAIKKEADKASRIYLATDPDREGEAISWHIFSVLSKENQKKCLRAVFNEITEKAVKAALENTRNLDQAQIDSYLARRLLDRLIGFKLSNYTQRKIGGASAGRVQSIALKFLADREDEIAKFQKESWYSLKVELMNGIHLSLSELSKDLETSIEIAEGIKKSYICFKSEEDAKKVVEMLGNHYTLAEIKSPKFESSNPPEVFKTSTIYETAINKLGFRSSMVERTLQKLYEGIMIGGESLALITYPRTDKTELSEDFVSLATKYIAEKYTGNYLGSKKEKFVKKELLVQGAHEGIRPVDLDISPEKLGKWISSESAEFRLYNLIWGTTLASLSTPSKNQRIGYLFENNGNIFSTSESIELFDGYKKIMREHNLLSSDSPEGDPSPFRDLKLGEKYLKKEEHLAEESTSPPPKYTEASLIKALEKKGIGRPSTYPMISKIIQSRNYAKFINKRFELTELGYKVSKDLEKNFSNFISYDYTRLMEEELDNISQSKTEWKKYLEEVFVDWEESFGKAEKIAVVEDRVCPECSSKLVYRFSRWGKPFIGCQSFPKCNYIEGQVSEKKEYEKLDSLCPQCNTNLVKKKNKKGEYFIACPRFPQCRYIEKNSKSEVKIVEGRLCPECSSKLVYRYSVRKKSKFISCSSFPKCKYVESLKT